MEHSALGSRESIELRIKGMTDQFDIAESVDDVLALQYRLYSFLGSESARAWTLAFMDKGQEVLDFMDKTEAIAEKALDRERDRELTSMTEGAHAKRSGDPDRQVAAKGSLSSERRCDRQVAAKDSLSSERRRDRQVTAKDSLSSERRRARPAPVADKKREDSPRLLPRDATASQSSSSVPSTRICFSSIRPSTRPVHSPTSIMHGACKDTTVWREAKHRRSGSSTTRSQHRRSQQRSREPVSGVLATPITNNVMKPRESTPLARTPAAKARCDDRRGECVEKHKDAMSPARRGTAHGARSALGPVRGKRSAATWSARGCEVQKNVIPTAAHAGARTRQRSGSASRRQSATSATSVRPESAQPEVKRRKKSAERGTSSASADARRDGRGESTRVPQKENHAGSPGNSRSSAAGPAPFAAWLRPRPTLWHQRSRPAQLRSSGIKAVVPSRRSVNVVRKPKVLWSAAVSQPRKGKWTKGARRTISTGDRACSVYGPASVRELTEKEVTNGPALRERKKRVLEEEEEEEEEEDEEFEQERRKRDDGWTRTMREQDEKEDGREETRKSEQERRRDKEEERQRAENEREAERKRANKIRRDDEEEEERQRAENEREEERKRLNKIQKDEEEERQRRENEREDERKRINQIRIDEEEERQRAENEREEERKRLNLRRDDEEERQRRANAREEERKRERLRDEHEKRRRRERDDEEQEKQKKHEEGKWREREKKKKLEAQALERRKEEERMALERQKVEERKEKERMALERQKQEEERKEKERGKLKRQKEEEEERKEKERKVLKWHREEEERKEKEWEALERQKDQMELEKQKESDRQREREGRRKQERNAEAENTKVVNKRRKEDKGEPEADGKRSANLEGNGSADSGRENEAQEKRKNETTTEDKTERRRKRFEVRITEAEKFVKKAEDELDEIWRKHRSVRDMCAEPAELKHCIDNARLVVGKADGRLESLQKLLDATNTFRDVVVKAIDTIKPRLGKVKRSLQELEDQCKEIIETTEDNTPSESAKEVEQRPKASKNEFRRKTATLQKLATRGVILVSLSDSED